jgi:hypothetical protein
MRHGIYYHGTCADHLENILQNGFGGDYYGERIWNDSYPHHTYYWNPYSLAKADGLPIDMARERAFSQAVGSATSALCRAKDCRIIVLEVRVPQSWMMVDYSGTGMEDAVCTEMHIPVSMIRSIRISNDLSPLRGVFISDQLMHSNNRLMPNAVERLTLKLMKDGWEYFMPDLLDSVIEWEEVPLRKYKPSKLRVA